jgi:hypothetical protein
MRGFSSMSDEERQQIKQQHSKVYDGYATNNVTPNMTPLMVYDAAQDKAGITVNAKGEVKPYHNHNVNEIAAKNLHYDEIDAAYDFDSPGPQQSMVQPNPGTKPYEFDTRGPIDSYGGELYDTTTSNFESEPEFSVDDEEGEEVEEEKIEDIKESVSKSLDMFKRFQKFN